ncbi:hypothetical protein TWF703_008217 [Orbilia oligospora]|uniref:Uncharacterized protein n=1 Tax=Orbilia oligospora TaxID=2813651 RepID=A0A7C8NVQ4_ORBOL|nr:hypothetical protein TWF703_008217 [Orbilia oligospora]
MACIQDIEVIRYSVSAFYSEHSKDLKTAQSLHEAAVIGLKAIAEDTWHDQETRTICDKQAEFHASRYHLIRSILDDNNSDLPLVLPTTLSAEESINSTLKSERLAIGLEESLLSEYLVKKEEDPDLAVPTQVQNLLNSTALSPYTLTLDSSLLPKQYTITVEMDSTNYSYWLNAHPINQPDQTCYRLRANRWGKIQFDNVAFYRATDRTIEYMTSNNSKPTIEAPEITEKRTWGSQKFTYAGRSFVWITPEGKGAMQLPTLYEAENGVGLSVKEPGYKVVGNELCWGYFKPGAGASAAATVTILGAVDQLFEELLLASQMTKMAIFFFGHDI